MRSAKAAAARASSTPTACSSASRATGAARRAVLHLEHQTEPPLGQAGSVHALGAGLDQDVRSRGHDLGAWPIGARHQMRMGQHRRPQPGAGAGPRGGQPVRAGEARHRGGEPAKRIGQVGTPQPSIAGAGSSASPVMAHRTSAIRRCTG